MERMTGKIQDYAWGSATAIPELLGQEPTGEPQAELWLGAHPAGASSVGGRSLDALVDGDPVRYVGTAAIERFGSRLPFLMKVLAAAKPLSLQAHPSRAQAEEGYAREQAAGAAAESTVRVYSDDWPKPEVLCALADDFEALCGFRAPAETYRLFEQLGVPAALELLEPLRDGGAAELEEVFARILQVDETERDVISAVVARAREVGPKGDPGLFARTAVELAEHFPRDPGILAGLLMNRIRLDRDAAVFLPAGNLHAYLRGTGVEVMANSDNVLRGGLTTKHIAIEELLKILDFTPGPAQLVECAEEAPGVWRYQTPTPEFAVWRLELDGGPVRVPGDGSGRVLLVVAGSATAVSTSPDGQAAECSLPLVRGQAAFLTADELVTVQGRATIFLSGSGV